MRSPGFPGSRPRPRSRTDSRTAAFAASLWKRAMAASSQARQTAAMGGRVVVARQDGAFFENLESRFMFTEDDVGLGPDQPCGPVVGPRLERVSPTRPRLGRMAPGLVPLAHDVANPRQIEEPIGVITGRFFEEAGRFLILALDHEGARAGPWPRFLRSGTPEGTGSGDSRQPSPERPGGNRRRESAEPAEQCGPTLSGSMVPAIQRRASACRSDQAIPAPAHPKAGLGTWFVRLQREQPLVAGQRRPMVSHADEVLGPLPSRTNRSDAAARASPERRDQTHYSHQGRYRGQEVAGP